MNHLRRHPRELPPGLLVRDLLEIHALKALEEETLEERRKRDAD